MVNALDVVVVFEAFDKFLYFGPLLSVQLFEFCGGNPFETSCYKLVSLLFDEFLDIAV